MDQSDGASAGEPSAFEYDAFISYRTSVVPDGPAGEELQRVLESYPVPAALRANIVAPKRFRSRLKIFRDITDLNAGDELTEALKQKLCVSRWLVVVASPETSRSEHCLEEIRYFELIHGSSRVLYLLVAGDASESIPAAATARAQPLAADVRASDLKGVLARLRGGNSPKSLQARFKLLAPILGCASPDDLIQRHRARVRRLAMQTVGVVLPVLAGIGAFGAQQVKHERTRLEAERLLAPMGLEDRLTEAEVRALWKAAASDKAVRLEFLRQAVQVSPKRFNRRADMITNAAVGIDPSLAKAVEDEIMRPLAGTPPVQRDTEVARVLLGLSLSIRDPVFLADAFRLMLASTEWEDPSNLKDRKNGEPLVLQFWHRVASLDANEGKEVAKEVVRVMASTREPGEWSRWAVLLRELGATGPETLRVVSSHLLRGPGQREQGFVSFPMCQLWDLAGWDFTVVDVRTFVPLLMACLDEGSTSNDVETWAVSLKRLLQRTPVSARAAATPFLLDAMHKGYVKELDAILVELPNMLTPEDRNKRVKVILERIAANSAGEDSAFGLEALARRLSAAPADVSEDQLASSRAGILAALAKVDDKNSNYLGLYVANLLKALAALPGKPSSSMYWQTAGEIVRLMKAADKPLSFGSDMQSIAEAASALSKPPGPVGDGVAVHAAVIDQIARTSIDKLSADDHLKSWLRVLRTLGGDLPAVRQESIARLLAVKIDALQNTYDANSLFRAMFALRADPVTVGKVTSKLLDLYAKDSGSGLISGLTEWPATPSASAYATTVRRVARLLGGALKGRNDRDMVALVASLPKAPTSRELDAALAREIGADKALTPLTRAQLRAAVLRQPASTEDLADGELVAALIEAPEWGDRRLEFPPVDRQRVVGALLKEIKPGATADAVFAATTALQSSGYELDVQASAGVIEALAAVLAKMDYESGIKRAAVLLSGTKTGFDSTHSLRVTNAVVDVMLGANDSSMVWHAAEALEGLPISLSNADAAKLAERICSILEGPRGEFAQSSWYRVLAKAAKPLSQEHRHRAALPALKQLAAFGTIPKEERMFSSSRDQLLELLQSLDRIPGGLVPDDQRHAGEQVLRILSNSSYVVDSFPLDPAEELSRMPSPDTPALIELLKWPTLGIAATREVVAAIENRAKQPLRGDRWRAAGWAKSSGFDVVAPVSGPR